jgi:hypothetical protein
MHITEKRSEKCKELSAWYADMAVRMRAGNIPGSEGCDQLSARYAEDARDLVNGSAQLAVVVVALACESEDP